jgi:glycosyltransferase involved in cell wall biosynthesis
MRVTLLAPLVAPLRTAQLGGAQTVVCDLGAGLVRAGNDALVMASPGSRIPGLHVRRAPGGPFPEEALSFAPGGLQAHDATRWPTAQLSTWLRIAEMVRERGGLVHGHAMDWPAFITTANLGLPVVHTLHVGPSGAAAVAAAAVANCRPRPCFIAPSRSAAAAWSGHLRVDTVIPNGVDPQAVPFGARSTPGLAVVAGRISPEKGTDLAVRAACRAGLQVVVAGGIYDPVYHREKVQPLIDGTQVRHVGALPRGRLMRLLARAAVAVMASLWEEPFGMLAVEAAMAGTPVAATSRGALTEIVTAQIGRLSERAEVRALARAIIEATSLDRAMVRRTAVRRFALSRMVDRHLRLYRTLSVHASSSL